MAKVIAVINHKGGVGRQFRRCTKDAWAQGATR